MPDKIGIGSRVRMIGCSLIGEVRGIEYRGFVGHVYGT